MYSVILEKSETLKVYLFQNNKYVLIYVINVWIVDMTFSHLFPLICVIYYFKRNHSIEAIYWIQLPFPQQHKGPLRKIISSRRESSTRIGLLFLFLGQDGTVQGISWTMLMHDICPIQRPLEKIYSSINRVFTYLIINKNWISWTIISSPGNVLVTPI